MKKILLTVTLLISIAALLNGCANVDGVSEYEGNSLNSAEVSSNNSNISQSVDSVVSTNNTEEFPTKCKIYKQIPIELTEEQLLSFFNETPIRTYYEDSETVLFNAKNENGNISENSFTFCTETGILCMMAYGETYAKSSESADTVLAFASRDEAVAKISDKLKDFGLSPENWYTNKIYAVKANALDEFKNKVNHEVADTVEKNPYELDESELQKEKDNAERLNKLKSKDFYYVEIRPQLENIHFYEGNILLYANEQNIVPSTLQVCFSKDGFEFFSISNFTKTVSSDDAEITTFDSAKSWIEDKYNSIIFDGEYVINKIELVYIPVPQNDLESYNKVFETRPFYAFHCTITENYNEQRITQNIVTYFDSISGNEFATEQNFDF